VLEQVEQDLVSLVAAAVPDLRAEAFPDEPERYKLRHGQGAVLVVYRGSRYESPIGAGPIVQRRQLEWEINIVVRNLRGHANAYDALEQVRLAVTGFRPDGCGPCWITRDGFVSQGNGIWQYALRVATRKLAVERLPDEEHAFVTQVTLEGPHGTTEVPGAA